MKGVKFASAALGLIIGVLAAVPASAFSRGDFIHMANLINQVEGIAVGSDNNVYTVSNNGANLFIISAACPGANCTVTTRPITGLGANPNLIGLAFTPGGRLVVADAGNGRVLAIDTTLSPANATVVMTLPPLASSFLNAITFDTNGNIYVSDSRNGIIWTATGCLNAACPLLDAGSVVAKAWAGPDPLLSPPTDADIEPAVGANGIAFSNGGTRMFVANTGSRNIIQIPVANCIAGTPIILVTGINGPDGIAVQTGNNRIWVAANQSDEIVVIDGTSGSTTLGRVITKLGDFNGLGHCPKQGTSTCRPADGSLLFPASLAFSNDGAQLYVSNFAFNLGAGGATPSIDSPWTAQVRTWNVVKISTRITAPTFPPPPSP